MPTFQNYPTAAYDNLRQMLRTSVAKQGDKTLFFQRQNGGVAEYSYRRFASMVNALGSALLRHGLGGTPIVVMGENCVEWATVYMAVLCGAGVIVPVDRLATPGELGKILRLSGARAVFCSSAVYRKRKEISQTSVEWVSFDALGEWIQEGEGYLHAGDRSYLDVPIDPDAMSALVFTSGGGEQPTGVMFSHHNFFFALSELCKMIYFGGEDRFLSVLPLHHTFSAVTGLLCPIYRGASVAFSRETRSLFSDLRVFHPTVVSCVPLLLETVYTRLLNWIHESGFEGQVRRSIALCKRMPTEQMRQATRHKAFSDLRRLLGGRLHTVILGGAAADPEAIRGMRDFGVNVFRGYCVAECAALVSLNRDTYYNDDSMGQAMPSALLDVCDLHGDGTGEIRYRGGNVMLGYYGRPKTSAEVLRDGWLYTGDLGYIDENGFLYLAGRKKNGIVTAGGKTVFPEELEFHLNRARGIRESVVVGYFNSKTKGSDLVAVLYPDPEVFQNADGEEMSRAELDLQIRRVITAVNASVGAHKRIKGYVLRREPFEKNASGTILRAGVAEAAYADYRVRIGRGML